ncbi:MAG: alpha/beta fold hydrolase, partial [Candidatus Eisenbacteria bacterium]|nr:alpha/beta fold hydrolase [Candidatus Eisenbacteria bacterium]
EEVRFSARDGVPLAAWWNPAPAPARGVVVLAHGRESNRAGMLPRARFLVRSGFDVLDLDLRLHGGSGGSYMTPGYFEARDVLGAVDWLERRGARGPVVLLGHSYGAVAVLHAAAQSPRVAAVIADAAFIHPVDMMGRSAASVRRDPGTPLPLRLALALYRAPFLDRVANWVFRLRTGAWFTNGDAAALAAVRKLHAPAVLFLAGELDPIAPPADARRLLDETAAPLKRLMVLPGATHATYGTARAAWQNAALAFLDSVAPGPAGR